MNTQKKIVVMHVINSYSLAGAEKLVFDLVTKMDKDKFEVLVCSVGRRGDKIEQTIRTHLQQHGIKSLSLDKPPHKRRLKAIWKLHQYLQENHVIIVHTHCPSPDFYGKLAALLARIPLVFSTIHNVQGYRAFNEKILKNLTTKYVTISKTVRQYAASQLNIPLAKIEVIYNAIDMDRFTRTAVDCEVTLKELRIANGRKIITTIGRLTQQKGHLYLLEAAEAVVKEFPNVHFLIVGDEFAEPDLSGYLRKKVEIKNMQDKILFTGVHTDIPEILSITDVFVLPSLWEGLPVALLEAMAAGVPVIATSVGSNPEVVVDGMNGFLIPPRNPQTLAQRIKELLGDPEKAKRIGAKGQRIIRKFFSIDRMVHEYEQLYLEHVVNKERLHKMESSLTCSLTPF